MSNFKEIIKHGGNYLIANLATKALAFISIPVYTRILTTYDYGIVSIFLGVVGILSNLFTLCMDQSVSRYYYDKKNLEDFRRFVGTSSLLAIMVFIINAGIFASFATAFGNLIKLEGSVVYLFIPMAFVNIVGLTFEQIFNPMKKSKKIALSSLCRVYLGFLFSVILIFMMDSYKYYGQIIGQIFAGCVMLVYWVKSIRPYFTVAFEKKYINYIFLYSVPLIPYVLSGIIIGEFAKIAIANVQGISDAGFYSLALTITSVVGTIVFVTNQAWTPYYFEYMNSKKYDLHDRDMNRIFKITLIIALLVSAFGKEIGMLLAKSDFTVSLYLIPILVIAPVMHQFSYVYMRNIFFSKKTYYLSIVVISSGIFNIILNILLIPYLGQIGGAISYVFSYILMGILAWFISKFILNTYTTSPILFIKSFILYIPFGIITFIIYEMEYSLKIFVIKAIVLLTFSILLTWDDRYIIVKAIKNLIHDKNKKL